MKPPDHAFRTKNWIPFANFALVNATPDKLRLRDHLFPFEGAQVDDKYLWGLYGTASANEGLFIAQAYAQRSKKQALTLQGWYRVDKFDLARAHIDAAVAEQTGFINLDRLRKDFREELHAQLLGLASEVFTGFRRNLYEDKSISDIVVAHPRLVREFLNTNRKINMIVHPVRQAYDTGDKRLLTIATMRHIKARVMDVQVRYLEHIKVVY